MYKVFYGKNLRGMTEHKKVTFIQIIWEVVGYYNLCALQKVGNRC